MGPCPREGTLRRTRNEKMTSFAARKAGNHEPEWLVNEERLMLSSLPRLGGAVGLSSFRRNLSRQALSREPESRLLFTASWIPACAGMTDQGLLKRLIWTRLRPYIQQGLPAALNENRPIHSPRCSLPRGCKTPSRFAIGCSTNLHPQQWSAPLYNWRHRTPKRPPPLRVLPGRPFVPWGCG